MTSTVFNALSKFGISNISSKTLGNETTLFFKSEVSIPEEVLQNLFPEPEIKVDNIADILKESALEDSRIPAYQYTITFMQD